MIEIFVILIGCNSGEGAVEIFVCSIARECVSADRLDLGKIDLLKLCGIVECVVADLSTCTELDLGKLSRTVEGVIADLYVVTDGK